MKYQKCCECQTEFVSRSINEEDKHKESHVIEQSVYNNVDGKWIESIYIVCPHCDNIISY